MKKTSYRWIVFLIFVLVIQISANNPGYQLEFQDDHFLLEGILQVQAANQPDHPREFLVSGKNYIGREIFIYLLEMGPDNKPVIKWQSPNLFEDRSILAIASGHFTGATHQLLAMSNSKLYIYRFDKDQPELEFQGDHDLRPLNIAAGDVNGDGRDELIVAVVGQVTNTIYNCAVQVWGFKDNKFDILVQSGLIGNIRSLAVGDLDGDKLAEIVAEEGPRTNSGNIHVLSFVDGKVVERYCLNKALKNAVYGMKIRAFASGIRLITATSNGKIDFFAWNNNKLVQSGNELTFSSGLVDVDAADLNGDNLPDLLVAGYPQRFLILSNMGGNN